MLGHKPKEVMVQVMKGAGVDPNTIRGVKWFRCPDCAGVSSGKSVSKVAAPPPYTFNHSVIVDVFYIRDMARDVFGFLSILCNGTTFHVVTMVCQNSLSPPSHKCWMKFETRWASWAGFCRELITDRGAHNKGSFSRGLVANGVVLRQGALETPEHIGRGERHGGILKQLMKKVIHQHHAIGKDQMKQVAAVCMEVKNDTVRKGGFTPSQWVLGRYPRRPGSLLEEDELAQLGVLQSQMDGTTAFGRKAEMRFTAQKCMVKMDCSRRYASAMLRNASHVDKQYQVGNLIMYRSEDSSTGEPGSVWQGPARITGVEGDVVWCQHGGVPVATAFHQMRPASTAELFAAQVMSRSMRFSQYVPPDTGDQQSFVDTRSKPSSAPSAANPLPEVAPVVDASGQVPEDQLASLVDLPAPTRRAREDPDTSIESHPDVFGTTKRQKKDRPKQSVTLVEEDELDTPLEKHLRKTGVTSDDPGMRLTRTLAQREGSAAASSSF